MTDSVSSRAAKRPEQRYPLHLPPGSIRALLTLVLVAFVILQLKRGAELGLVWTETLMIVLAHYFTSRRLVNLDPATQRRLESDGLLEQEEHPLYLPRHSIRLIIIVAFGGFGWHMHQQGRLFEPPIIATLTTVGAYMFGNLTGGLLRWLTRNRTKGPSGWWMDLKALVTLTVVSVAITLEFTGIPVWLPVTPTQISNTTLAIILFYFGSR